MKLQGFHSVYTQKQYMATMGVPGGSAWFTDYSRNESGKEVWRLQWQGESQLAIFRFWQDMIIQAEVLGLILADIACGGSVGRADNQAARRGIGAHRITSQLVLECQVKLEPFCNTHQVTCCGCLDILVIVSRLL